MAVGFERLRPTLPNEQYSVIHKGITSGVINSISRNGKPLSVITCEKFGKISSISKL